LVRRSFSLVNIAGEDTGSVEDKTVLRTEYKATTNRMLRVAVNGFFESLNVVVQVMEELDVDVLHEKGLEDLQGVQGVEQGMIGSTVGGT
jgi:EKC/KEOPS complex subunit PCC1/LAGE3